MTDLGGSDELRDEYTPTRSELERAWVMRCAELDEEAGLEIESLKYSAEFRRGIKAVVERRVAEANAETARAKAWGQKGWDKHNLQWRRREVAEARLEALRAAYPNTIPMLEAALDVEREGESHE